MESIMRKNPQLKNSVSFHILTDDIYEQDREKLEKFTEKWAVSISLYYMNDEMIDKFTDFPRSKVNGKTIYSMYYRWLIPHVVDQGIQKVLYLDVDTVCNRNILPLLQDEFEEPVLAVHDLKEKEFSKRLGLSSPYYFDTGLVHMNINAMINEHVTEKIFQCLYDCIGKNIDLLACEQDAANIVLDGKVKFGSDSYHYPLYLSSKMAKKIKIHKEAENAYLIHFLGISKPWKIEVQDFSTVKTWHADKVHSDWKDELIVGTWDRRAYRVASRAAWINNEYIKWLSYKVHFILFHFMKAK